MLPLNAPKGSIQAKGQEWQRQGAWSEFQVYALQMGYFETSFMNLLCALKGECLAQLERMEYSGSVLVANFDFYPSVEIPAIRGVIGRNRFFVAQGFADDLAFRNPFLDQNIPNAIGSKQTES